VLSTIALQVKSMPSRCRSNRAALDVSLTTEDLSELDRWFLPPTSKRPLHRGLISFSTWIIDG
jgi:diketogulonate reductase-like aldo/keto reductase